MKRFLSLSLSIVMILSVLLSAVSCDEQFLLDLLEEPIEDVINNVENEYSDNEDEEYSDEEEKTTKKKNEKTTYEEYETVTERYSEDYPEYTYPSETDWITEWDTDYPVEWPSEWNTEWNSEWVTGHVHYDYPKVDHCCDMCYVVMDCYDDNCDAYCDACGMPIGATDVPVDHKCRDKDPRDHYCDECGIRMTECKEKNHYCYICGAWMSECADNDMNHYCDVCNGKMSECYDYDGDKICDQCGLSEGTDVPVDHKCRDKDPRDHYCDECGIRMTECKEKNHYCYICGAWMSECADNDMNHYCDVCNGKMSECYDYDGDKICDQCGLSEGTDVPVDHKCRDKDPRDHYCDECGIRMTECKEKNHYCYICGAWMSECADWNYDGYCDTCGTQLSAPEVPDAPAEIPHITIAEAIGIGNSFENKGEHTSEKYIITGVITEIANERHGNLYITDGVDTIYIYGLFDATGELRYDMLENPPKVGDTVTLLGVVGRYIDPQMKNVWMIEHIPA